MANASCSYSVGTSATNHSSMIQRTRSPLNEPRRSSSQQSAGSAVCSQLQLVEQERLRRGFQSSIQPQRVTFSPLQSVVDSDVPTSQWYRSWPSNAVTNVFTIANSAFNTTVQFFRASHVTGCDCADCCLRREQLDPDMGDYKQPPTDWHGQMMRRRRGRKLLLSMMDVYDRLEWFEHRVVRLQYPSRSETGSEYGGRTLLLTPDRHYEFYKGEIRCKRNIWMSTPGHVEAWSLEDQYLALIFNFQIDIYHFMAAGCRDTMYVGQDKQIERIQAYGFQIRKRAIAEAKKRLRAEAKMPAPI